MATALSVLKFSNWKSLGLSIKNRRISKPSNNLWDGFLNVLIDFAEWSSGGLLGFITNWTMTKLVAVISAGAIFIYTFNWNATDEELYSRFQQARLAWFEQLGETIGASMGWITCGIIPSAVVYSFNKPMGLYVLNEVGEEAYEEILSELAVLVQMAGRAYANAALTNIFITIRWLIKNAANNQADTLLGGVVEQIFNKFPKLKDAARKWGEKGGKPWIISSKIEELIDNAPIGNDWKAFLEGLLEGLGEGCLEAGFTFANAFDTYIANQALVTGSNSQNTVVITPNRSVPDEKFILHGDVNQLKPAITQLVAAHQIIYNKDVGYNLGMPLIQRAFKQISEYVIEIFLKSKPKPPYGVDAKEHQITINSANKLKFTDFDKVIRALGGGNDEGHFGYNYGNYLAIAQMSDGSELKVWTDSVEHAQERVEALEELTEATIQTLNITLEVRDYERKKIEALAKDVYRVYPWKISILRKTKIYGDYDKSFKDRVNLDGSIIKATRQGYFKHSPKYSLVLYGEQPVNWSEVMLELTAPVTP